MSLSFDLAVRRGAHALHAAIADIDGVVGLVGPSGAGKTTLLLALAGLVPAHGTVTVDGEALHGLPTHARRVGVLFQDARVFPHLTVAANLAYGAAPGADTARWVEALDLGDLLARRPRTLSGGELRRVALARTLLAAPRVLALDEPLVGLDPARRAALLPRLRAAVQAAGVPTLWVSHHAEEVLAVADRVVVLDGGRVVADGPPAALLGDAGGLAARAAGLHNVLAVCDVMVHAGRGTASGRWGDVALALPLPVPDDVARRGAGRVLLAPQEVILAVDPPGRTSARNVLAGTVRAVAVQDGVAAVTLAVGAATLVVDVTPGSVTTLGLEPGAAAWALVKTRALRWA
ncbi:MAG: ATP-binding cassette domain-containing protein [Alphaproteobacteria bacterium]|nr:ATP-binding cassette domain-containing protein [Alphaproteobacteria bacterium]